MKVLSVGLVVCDVPLYPVSKAVMELDASPIAKPVMSTGGDALNVAVTLRRLGAASSLAGFVGQDANGDFILRALQNEGVDASGVLRHPELGTAASYILIEPGGHRHFVIYSDLNHALSYEDVPAAMLEGADVVYFGSAMCMTNMDGGGAAALFRRARSLGKLTVADTSAAEFGKSDEYWQNRLGPMLRETDVFVPSYDEAVMITGKTALSEMRGVFSAYPMKLLVVKTGSEGCYVTDFKDEWTVPTFREFTPVDTTGAGDSFVGGFIRGLLAGWAPDAAASFANAVASFNVEKLGATGGVPDFDTAYGYVTKKLGAERFPL